MTNDEYGIWMDRHAALFGMMRQEDAGMFRQWRVEFEAMGFTATELQAATDFISREASGITRWDHLQAIRDFIKGKRRQADEAYRRKLEASADTMGTCTKCGDTGRVCGLPHPKQLGPDGWAPLISGVPILTISAVCTCLRGKWQLDAWEKASEEFKEKHKRPLTLVEYTKINSQWEAQLRELAELQKLRLASEASAREADKLRRFKVKEALGRAITTLPQALPPALKDIRERQPGDDEPGDVLQFDSTGEYEP